MVSKEEEVWLLELEQEDEWDGFGFEGCGEQFLEKGSRTFVKTMEVDVARK